MRVGYAICEVDLRRHAVRLYSTRSDGTPYAYLSALPRDLEGGAGRLLFAINAGMFDSKLKPVGLYVEEGQELVHANTKSGRGNFHMKPNGIFYISGSNAAVAETHAFLRLVCLIAQVQNPQQPKEVRRPLRARWARGRGGCG